MSKVVVESEASLEHMGDEELTTLHFLKFLKRYPTQSHKINFL